MADETPAKVWSDQRDLPIYLGDSGDGFRLPFKEKWRLPDTTALLVGFVATASLMTLNLQSGNALIIGAVGAALTAAGIWALSKLPASGLHFVLGCSSGWPTCVRGWCVRTTWNRRNMVCHNDYHT